MYNNNPLYQYYLWQQQQNQNPNQNLRQDQQVQAQGDGGDVDFGVLWKYLNYLKKGYNTYANITGNPTTGNYLSQGWDAAKNWLSPSTESGAGAGVELGGAGAEGGALAGAETGAAYGADVAGLSGVGSGMGAGAGAGGAASFGADGVGLAPGGAAAVIAPLVMGYLKYQAGSGVNEPVAKSYDQRNAAKTLYDMAGGAEAPTRGAYYGTKLPDWMTGQNTMGGDGITMDDPRRVTAYDLYDELHRSGQGHTAQNGTGQGGWNDIQADAAFGDRSAAVAKLLGVNQLPDWTNRRYDDPSRPGEVTPWTIGNPDQNKLDAGWNALSDAERGGYSSAAYSRYGNSEAGPGVDVQARGIYDRAAQQADVEKLLGYFLGNRGY